MVATTSSALCSIDRVALFFGSSARTRPRPETPFGIRARLKPSGRRARFEIATRTRSPSQSRTQPIALTLNELLTNAVKHSAATPEAVLRCTLACTEDEVQVTITNPARLPAGFNVARIPGGVSGLGLVRALLPKKSASLSIEQDADAVVATVTLRPPGVQRAGA